MSGYLEVKYPLKSNLGLNPFRSWKRQWCILRPSPTSLGGSLAVYCSEAGAAAGAVDLPAGCVVRRAKSRTRPYAFAVFGADDRKPRILLAAPSLQDAFSWMDKIQALLDEDHLLGTESLLKDSYSVTVTQTELSRKCGLSGDGLVSVSSRGLLVSLRALRPATLLSWPHICDVTLLSDSADKHTTCVLSIDSSFGHGGGQIKLYSGCARSLAAAVTRHLQADGNRDGGKDDSNSDVTRRRFSRSDGDLRTASRTDLESIRRSSWYSGPSEVSLDDLELVSPKPPRPVALSRCVAAKDLTPGDETQTALADSFDDSMCDRHSLASVASGIYEEIPELPCPAVTRAQDDLYCAMGRDVVDAPVATSSLVERMEEPMYESVSECVFAIATTRRPRRHPPPPLPPRLPYSTLKLGGSYQCEEPMSNSPRLSGRHGSLGSLGSLPRCRSLGSAASPPSSASSANTLPSKARQHFSVFRKRLKSDSRIMTSPKSETLKENKDVERKKKKFEFTPTRDIFKNFKMGRKKGAKLTKGEAKSCEYLDEPSKVNPRSSKSVECLEQRVEEDEDTDLSIEFNDDAVAALALPQEIVDLILRGRQANNQSVECLEQRVEEDEDTDLSIEFNDDAVAALALPQEIVDLILRGRQANNQVPLPPPPVESDYMAMSAAPLPPPASDHHYIAMAPVAKLA